MATVSTFPTHTLLKTFKCEPFGTDSGYLVKKFYQTLMEVQNSKKFAFVAGFRENVQWKFMKMMNVIKNI